MKDFMPFEKVQRRATKFILGEFSSDYKYRLVISKISLKMALELNDILFVVKSLKKTPSKQFNILNYISMSTSQIY